MTLTKKLVISVITVFCFLVGSSIVTTARQGDLDYMQDLKLTNEQIQKLGDTIGEYSLKQHKILSELDAKLVELANEIRKEDRFDTKVKETRSVRKANKIVKEIATIYGKLIRTRVEYILKAKNVLTFEQRLILIQNLNFEEDFYEDDLPHLFDLDILAAPLALTNDQVKSILKLRTDQQIKELKIELKIAYKMLDLQNEIMADEIKTENVDRLLLEITDQATKLIKNKVNHMLKSKDVLTTDQKKKLIHILMIMEGQGY